MMVVDVKVVDATPLVTIAGAEDCDLNRDF
jgi:hypothetical protein